MVVLLAFVSSLNRISGAKVQQIFQMCKYFFDFFHLCKYKHFKKCVIKHVFDKRV